MTFLFVVILATLLYIAQLLRKLVWLLALVTQNQMIAMKFANNELTYRNAPRGMWPYVVVGFYEAVRFPWIFRTPESFEPPGNS